MENEEHDILVIGDIHASVRNINEVKILQEQIEDLMTDNLFKCVVILGDFGHQHNKMMLQSWLTIYRFFNQISAIAYEKGIEVYYIVGNHDMQNNQVFLEDQHFFDVFSEFKNITVVDRPFYPIKVSSFGDHNFRFGMVPYVAPGRFKEAIEHAQWSIDGVDLIFAHQEFKGCKMGAIESTVGDEWSDNLPLVISGHIHDEQWVGRRVYYPGAPYQTSFGDTQKKQMIAVDCDKNSSTGFKITPIPSKVPKRINVKCDCEGFKNYQLPENAVVRIHVRDTTENLKKMEKTKKYKELSKHCKVVSSAVDVFEKNKVAVKSRNYTEILADMVNKEGEVVKRIHEEVIRNAHSS